MESEPNSKIAVDEFRHIVHLMDLNKGTEDLSESISHLGPSLFRDPVQGSNWSWFLYDKDGHVNDYHDNQFYFLPLSDERIYPAFIGEMLKRSNQIWMQQSH